MSASYHHPQLARIEALVQQVRDLIEETREPGVVLSLRQALYYLHVSGTYLGDDLLSPEVDAASTTWGSDR